jgi:Chalcone isomerase like
MATSIPIQSLACRRLCQYSLHCSSPSRHALARQLPPASRSFATSRTRCQSILRNPRDAAAGKDGRYKRRANLAAAGLSATILATYALLTYNDVKLDAPPNVPEFTTSPIVTPSEDHPIEQIPTGTSTIPTFPKFIHLPTTEPPEGPNVLKQAEEEYQLVGLGIRTVSFLSIQVYVVGLYIAVADIAALQERLIRLVDPVATALVPGERQTLRTLLMDPEKGDQIWSEVLKHEGLRTAMRIVPTRNTDFMHLRDGWVRGITGRTQRATQAGNSEFDNESFGEAVRDFKGMFGGGARKSVPKGQTLLLARGAKGAMTAWYKEDGKPMMQLGAVTDERISRLVWLGYLAGKTVASESARQSIVDGVMEYVERPVGTVAAQVV